jgi:hypothetical protein
MTLIKFQNIGWWNLPMELGYSGGGDPGFQENNS